MEVDIAKNVKVIEWLKTELITEVATLFQSLDKADEEGITDALAGLIIDSFLLGKRVGISYSRLDRQILQRIRANIEGEHAIEKWYGELSILLHYFQDKKR